METSIVKSNKEIVSINKEQKELIKRSIMPPNSTDDELQLFVIQAQRTGLDPFTRQIYCTKAGNKLSIQSTIDGFRLIAERSGEYEGQTPVQWCGKDGQWVEVWLKDELPEASRVGVYRKGFKEPLFAVARFKSYAQIYQGKLGYMWNKMPDLMIGKVAEALALRKAFPQDLSGLYTPDEMAQAIPEAEFIEIKTEKREMDKTMNERIDAIKEDCGIVLPKDKPDIYEKITNCQTVKELTDLYAGFTAENKDIPSEIQAEFTQKKNAITTGWVELFITEIQEAKKQTQLNDIRIKIKEKIVQSKKLDELIKEKSKEFKNGKSN
jgi:phage recombination protein Bet